MACLVRGCTQSQISFSVYQGKHRVGKKNHGKGKKSAFQHHRFGIAAILSCAIIFILGCNLSLVEYWVHRSDSQDNGQPAENTNMEATTNLNSENGSAFGTRCIDSEGIAPCPLEACVVSTNLYEARNVIMTELIGKSNPDNYACCAEFQFTNNSGSDVMTLEYWVYENKGSWRFNFYPMDAPYQTAWCTNSYSRHDGKVTIQAGLTQIVVLYAYPHCDWIEADEPGLENYRVPINGVCSSN